MPYMGNDGNLLQHAIEAEVMCAMARQEEEVPRVQLIATHGMRPLETGRADKRPVTPGLSRALSLATCSDPDSPRVLEAYEKCGARPDLYPNSVRIAEALFGMKGISGRVYDVNGGAAAELALRYEGKSGITIRRSDWRDVLVNWGPWMDEVPLLMTMDPNSYTVQAEGAAVDRAKISARDLRRVWEKIGPLVRDGKATLLVFCYSLQSGHYQAFKNDITALASASSGDVGPTFLEIAGPHVCAMLTAKEGVRTAAKKAFDFFFSDGRGGAT